jgi:ankyrin repeat protein
LFHYAAQYDNEELAMALLQTAEGAKQLGELNKDGKTPYDLALANGSAKIQRLVRRFQEGLLELLDEKPQTEEQEVVDNKDELDALINSLYEQSAQSQPPTEPVESEPVTEPEE